MTTRIGLIFQIGLVTALLLAGCSDDDPAAPPGTGTIAVAPFPNQATSGWILDLPGGGSTSGQGESTMYDMATGSYTLTWQPISGWLTPDPATVTKELRADATTVFAGTYISDDPDQAVLIIDPEPDDLDASWRLEQAGATGSIVGSGADTLSFMMPVEYTVYWNDIVGWTTPDPVTLTAVSPDTTTFTGTYVVDLTAYPQPRIFWNYGESPLPEGFPLTIGGSANDDQDGRLPPESLTWTSDLDGVLTADETGINSGDLSVGDHEIRLRAVDGHGLVAEDTVTIRIVTPPALSPTASVTLPDWGAYDVAQGASDSPLFGWDGTDPVSASGHPAYVRFLILDTLLPDGLTYAQTRADVEANLDFLVSPADWRWSGWRPYSENELDRRVVFPGLARLDGGGHLIHYMFVVQAWSETGAISSTWDYAGNMAHFFVLPAK